MQTFWIVSERGSDVDLKESARRTNILFVFVSMPVGGAEQLCFELLKGLDPQRYHALTCCIGSKGVVGKEIERAGFEVIELGRMKSRQFDFGAVLDLRNLMKERKIDIVHTNMYHANLYGRLGALLLRRGRPAVVTAIHSVYNETKWHRLIINRVLNRYTDRILAVSEPAKDDIVRFEKAPVEKVVVFPPGVDFGRLDVPLSREEAKARIGLAGSELVIGTVGRLIAAKRHGLLMQAMAVLREKGHQARLLIVGGGPMEESLRQQAAELQIEDRVLLLGIRRDVPQLLKAMDVFVMSSVYEGTPVALLEAMAAGLPCVITSVPGMVTLLGGEGFGRIVPSGDELSMADAIADLLLSENKRLEYGQAVRQRAREQYGREAMIGRLESIYRDIRAVASGGA